MLPEEVRGNPFAHRILVIDHLFFPPLSTEESCMARERVRDLPTGTQLTGGLGLLLLSPGFSCEPFHPSHRLLQLTALSLRS